MNQSDNKSFNAGLSGGVNVAPDYIYVYEKNAYEQLYCTNPKGRNYELVNKKEATKLVNNLCKVFNIPLARLEFRKARPNGYTTGYGGGYYRSNDTTLRVHHRLGNLPKDTVLHELGHHVHKNIDPEYKGVHDCRFYNIVESVYQLSSEGVLDE